MPHHCSQTVWCYTSCTVLLSSQQHQPRLWQGSTSALIGLPIRQVSFPACKIVLPTESSSSRMRVINHNWSATKQRLHLQSVASGHLGQPLVIWASQWSSVSQWLSGSARGHLGQPLVILASQWSSWPASGHLGQPVVILASQWSSGSARGHVGQPVISKVKKTPYTIMHSLIWRLR